MAFTSAFLPSGFAKEEIDSRIQSFDSIGNPLFSGRNKIKVFDLNNGQINIKSFKIPALINKIAYRYFRKSKAKRSFEYAQVLLKKNINTPAPIAFYEEHTFLGLRKSFYVSENLQYDLTFRELINIPDLPDHENILRQFTHFCFEMHEKGIEFLDNSPGNTLIKKTANDKYQFYLVDLNRMQFHKSMSFELRMKNMQRLTPKKEMIKIMSNEYARWYDKPEQEIFESLWSKTIAFKNKFDRKKRLKKKLKIWKKK